MKKVSVILPNYNYASYLTARLTSIVRQSYPIHELIFLDDGSSDESLDVLDAYFSNQSFAESKLIKIINKKNSGSVIRQWIKGMDAATGDYIWIAEADDFCSEHFLEEALKGFDADSNVILSYVQSNQVDSAGNLLSTHYREYTNDIDGEKWKDSYVRSGLEEIMDTLVIKNTIPNVSAAVFRKMDFSNIINEWSSFKVAGDWFFYVWLLQQGSIYYSHRSLNYHRRHDASIISKENRMLQFKEISGMQDYIMNHFDIKPTTINKTMRYRSVVKSILGIE